MKKTTTGLLAALVLATTAHAATVIDGKIVPEPLMNLARTAVSLNSPEAALKRPDNIYTKHPYYNQLISRFDFKTLNEEAAKLMVQVFSQQEIEALVRFQSSAEGRSITSKMQAYQELVGAVVQNQMNAAIQGQTLDSIPKGNTPATPKPVMPYTPPAAPALPQGHGGSPIGK